MVIIANESISMEHMEPQFNVLWLNPNNSDSFPAGLAEALTIRGYPRMFHEKQGEPIQVRLRRQMQADALEPLNRLEKPVTSTQIESFSAEQIEEVVQFLRLQVRLFCATFSKSASHQKYLQAQDRLHLVLSYLRDNYIYCFWCGLQYETEETMRDQCPGPDEESHD
jgi:hypothetical protein